MVNGSLTGVAGGPMAELAHLTRSNRGTPIRARRHVVAPQQLYMAFLSYSHHDAATADRLQDGLEQFRVPTRLVGRLTDQGVVPKRLTPIFRDRHELAAAHDLSEEIEGAIAGSRFLIVLCSPAAARSHWINEEIICFKRMHREDRILAAIIDGEPFASELPGREQEECFPPALRVHYDSRGRPTGQRIEPIAADLRDHGDGWAMGLLKIAAGMLGVGLDDLAQREAQRRHKRLYAVTAASIAGMLVASGLAYAAIDARDAARDQRREAEGLIGFMLGDLREKLEPVGRLDVLDGVGVRALAYYEGQDKSELSDEALAQRSRALTLMGEIATQRGDLDGALRRYSEAMAGTAEAVRRASDDPQRLFDHAQNVFYVGDVAWKRGQTRRAEAQMREYKRLADRMVAIDPSNPKWQLEQKYADTNLGIVLVDVGRYQEAAGVFRHSLDEAERLVAEAPGNADYRKTQIETLAWLADALEYNGQIDDALARREQQIGILDGLLREARIDPDYRRQAMVANRAAGRLYATRGDLAEGLRHLQAATKLGQELYRIEPDNADWAGLAAFAQLDRAAVELAAGDLAGAGSSTGAGCDSARRLVQRDDSVSEWRFRLGIGCLGMRQRLAMAAGAHDTARSFADQAARLARAEAAAKQTADVRFGLAGAELLRGLAATAAGDRLGASEAFRAAASAWPGGASLKPSSAAQQVLILEGLGRKDKAEALAAKLAEMGYRHPIYLRDRREIRRGVR